MSARRVMTAIGALVAAAIGFAAGAGGSAWQTRDARTQPWRKIRVEHRGSAGEPTRTRVVFENPKLALQAVELARDAEQNPDVARVSLRDGAELTIRYEDGKRPTSIEGPDGSAARFSYSGSKVRVTFVSAAKEEVSGRGVTVPVELRSALRIGALTPTAADGSPVLGLFGPTEAWAQQPQAEDKEEPVTVERSLPFELDLRVQGGDAASGLAAELETSCPPYTCLPSRPEIPMPGATPFSITVASTKKRGELTAPDDAGALAPFRTAAGQERAVAQAVMPDVATAIAAVGVTAIACRSEKLDWSICVPELGKDGVLTGGAVRAVVSHQVATKGAAVDERATELFYQEQARALLDKPVKIELCAARDGFARACASWTLRPFGDETPGARGVLDLRRGIGGTLAGSFFVTQSDGADCKFSPSPKTAGPMKLTFDNEKHTATASLKATERGTRSNLGCSLGVANMSWSQSYTITATQTFTKAELEGTGKLPIRMNGSMSGTGSYSFSNCRTSGGGSVNCPAGKGDSYAYPVELVGEIDLSTQTGSGRITVQNAPLSTSGSWRIPAEKTP